MKNRSKINENWTPGLSWGGLGAILAPRAKMTSKSCFVDPSWTPFGDPQIEPNGLKIEKKSIQKCLNFWIDFWSLFWSILERFGVPKWMENRSKMELKSIKKVIKWMFDFRKDLEWIFDQFFIDFAPRQDMTRATKHYKNQWFFNIFVF